MPNQFLGVLLHTIAMYGLSHVRTELLPSLLVVPSLAPHPVQANGQLTSHGNFGGLSSSPHHQVDILAAPFRQTAYRDLRRLHQQETHDRTPLFGDVPQAPPIPAGFFQRHQAEIGRDLRQLLWHRHRMVQARTRVMNQLQAVALNEGLRCKKRLFRADGRQQLESFQLAPWARRRRRELLELLDRLNPTIAELSQAVEREAEKCPEAQRLMTHPGVGALTALAFVLIIGETERFQCGKQIAVSQLGTQIRGKSSSSSSLRMCRASSRSVFCLRPRLARITSASPLHSSTPNPSSSRSNHRPCPLASMPTRTTWPT